MRYAFLVLLPSLPAEDYADSKYGRQIVINNNSNQNESHGPTDLENDNPNETELEVEGHGGGIVNNNSNVNRVVGGGGSSPGTESPSEEISRWPRIRVTNNNGNKNVVRRTKAQRL